MYLLAQSLLIILACRDVVPLSLASPLSQLKEDCSVRSNTVESDGLLCCGQARTLGMRSFFAVYRINRFEDASKCKFLIGLENHAIDLPFLGCDIRL